ncbi:MAG TPA: hypothetical protein VGN01_08615 [Acidobacteriaceae bacterium]|jgi:hypothetical protein
MADNQTNRSGTIVYTWTSSYWFVALLALMIGLLAIAASLGFDWVLHGDLRPIYGSDLLEGALAALFSGAALLKLQARRRELLVRMQIVEDVNHHVRNALACVVLSASLREDQELNALVKDACERIDWVLNDVLPQSIEANTLKAEHPTWTSGRQLEPTRLRAYFSSRKNPGNTN